MAGERNGNRMKNVNTSEAVVAGPNVIVKMEMNVFSMPHNRAVIRMY